MLKSNIMPSDTFPICNIKTTIIVSFAPIEMNCQEKRIASFAPETNIIHYISAKKQMEPYGNDMIPLMLCYNLYGKSTAAPSGFPLKVRSFRQGCFRKLTRKAIR